MRFAWLRETTLSDLDVPANATNKAILIVYNLVWWFPVVLPFLGVITYHAGFVAFLFVTLFRAAANAYRINLMPTHKAVGFPLRQP